MPSAFRLNLNLSPPRPSPRAEEPENPLASALLIPPSRVPSSGSTKSISPSPSPGGIVTIEPAAQADSDQVPETANSSDLPIPDADDAWSQKSTISLFGLSEDEIQFTAEERLQWAGDIQRTQNFNDFVQSITTTSHLNEEGRLQRFEALLDAQILQYSQTAKDRQATFARDCERLMMLAEESQSGKEDEIGKHEDIREKIVKEGRARRISVKEEAVQDLVPWAKEICDNEQEDYEREARRMQDVVADLLRRGEQKLQILQNPRNDDTDEGVRSPPHVPYAPSIPPSVLVQQPPMVPYPPSHYSGSPPTVVVPGSMPTRSRSISPPYSQYSQQIQQPERFGLQPIEEAPFFDNELDQREYEWIQAERVRDAAEDERHEIYRQTLHTIHSNFQVSTHTLSSRFKTLEETRNSEETSRESDFNCSLRSITSPFEILKTKIEKRFELLDGTENGFGDGLKHDIRVVAEREEKQIAMKRRKIRRSFDIQLAQDRASLQKLLDELMKLMKPTSSEEGPYPVVVGQPYGSPFTHIQPGIMPGYSPPIIPQPPSPVPMVPMGIPYHPVPIMPQPYSPIPRPPVRPPMSSHDAETTTVNSGPRTPSPPTGFSPQELFKLRNLSSLPLPRIKRHNKNTSSTKHRHKLSRAERAALLDEGLIKRRFAFAVSEGKRQIKFEQIQAERKRLFEEAELKRSDEFERSQQERVKRFMEGEQSRTVAFREKMKERRERFMKELERVGKGYEELEGRLTKSCMQNEKNRLEGMMALRVTLVDGKRAQWEEAAKRNERERLQMFESLVSEFRSRLTV